MKDTKKAVKILKKTVKYGFILGIAGVMVLFAVNGYVKLKSGKEITTAEELRENGEKADAILVLGAQVKADGRLSKMLKERVDTGIQLYKDGAADKIIMSGDHGSKDYDEVNAMKSYAIEQGVPSEDIFMDHAGFSTYDSMYRARDIFQAENIIVVTQKYHLYRAVYDAEALGLQAKGVVCDTAVYKGDSYRKFREVLARIKDAGYTIVKPEPKFLGDVIPVNGNGDLTNDKY